MSREKKENTIKDSSPTMGEAIPYKGLVVPLFGLEEFEVRASRSVC